MPSDPAEPTAEPTIVQTSTRLHPLPLLTFQRVWRHSIPTCLRERGPCACCVVVVVGWSAIVDMEVPP
jgi:hypothetical protein